MIAWAIIHLYVQKVMHACLLELIQEILEFVFDQVWDHGATLRSVEHILLWMILIRRAKWTVTDLREGKIANVVGLCASEER